MFEKKEHQNSGTLGKDTINNWIIPFLSVGKRFSFNKGEQPDVYFDEELYKNRFKIEQANGWLDGYKGLIMRYEYLDVTWIGMLLLGFISKFLKKFKHVYCFFKKESNHLKAFELLMYYINYGRV